MKTQARGINRQLRVSLNVMPGIIGGAIIGIVIVIAQASLHQTSALSVSSKRDCDSNAVINCGALTTTELKERYSQSGVATIYNYFGITSADISASDKTAVAGRVYRNGDVEVDNKIVATGAITAGRLNITGSTKVTHEGITFYARAPSVSFVPDSLAAFVIMENGLFKYAILAACGNPVKATPVSTPQPPTQPLPAPTPVVSLTGSTQAAPSTPTAAEPETLPAAGPASVLTVFAFAIAGGYAFHMTHRHVRHKRKSR